MTCQEIHEYIWDGVIEYLEHINEHHTRMIGPLKMRVVSQLLDESRITPDAYDALENNCACVACALYQAYHITHVCDCTECPIRVLGRGLSCFDDFSPWYNVNHRTIKSAIVTAKKIRNVKIVQEDHKILNERNKAILEEEPVHTDVVCAMNFQEN